jgi:hypothetical protein
MWPTVCVHPSWTMLDPVDKTGGGLGRPNEPLSNACCTGRAAEECMYCLKRGPATGTAYALLSSKPAHLLSCHHLQDEHLWVLQASCSRAEVAPLYG